MKFINPCPLTYPGGSDEKESACNMGDMGSISGLGRSPGEGTDNPLQYSCLENPMDGGAWQTTVHGVARVGHNLDTKPPQPRLRDHRAGPRLSGPTCSEREKLRT